MRRLLKIALREYIAYVRTVGFWLSMLLMPVGLIIAAGLPSMMEKSAPVPTLAVVDLTGQGFTEIVGKQLREPRSPAERPEAVIVASPVQGADTASVTAALKPYLAGEQLLPGGGTLDAAAIIHGAGGAIAVDLWSVNVADGSLERAVKAAVAEAMRGQRLRAAGLDGAEIAALDALEPKVTAFSHKAAKGEVSLRDRLPGIVGFGLGMLLWSVIFTGAGILLNSVIEEKSSRILEVLLASASTTEIMFGKILGVAGVTTTVLGVWAGLGGTILAMANPGIARDVAAVLLDHGLIFYFAVYLVGGYLMYAALFIAVGAFCETTREAQTLLGPVMIFLMVPVLFMSQAIRNPGSPLLEALSWIPPFTPFLMTARAASQPPLWEIAGTGLLMVLTTAGVVWIAGRAFRAGALSTGRLDLKAVIARMRRAE
jgi:ABC-2 type transport system permease protein